MFSVPLNNHRVNQAMDFLQSSCADDVDLREVADAGCLSKYHFSRVFKATTGETPIGFLQRIRIERAARMLVYKRSFSIGDIAYACAFGSAQSFSSAFRKRFEKSPRDFRNENACKFTSYWSNREPGFNSEFDYLLGNNEPIDAPQVTIEILPPRRVAYMRFAGPYGDSSPFSITFDTFRSWARQRNLLTRASELFVTSWDNPNVTAACRCRLDVCLPVADEMFRDPHVGLRTIPGGQYAVMHVTGRDMDVRHKWEYFMMHWLPTADYLPTFGPNYEIYRPSSDGRQHYCRALCLPVQRK